MPHCPVEDDVRRWVEARMAWLAREFGEDRLRTATVVTPTTEFFPVGWRGTEDEAHALAERIAGFMGLDFARIEIYSFDNAKPPEGMVGDTSAMGYYHDEDGVSCVGYDSRGLEDPLQLAATFAHEFAHIHLLGHKRIDPDTEDHELLTDLCTVALGMGVICSNSGVYEKRTSEWWQIGRAGYLDLRTFGYAFAVFAHLRGEEKPSWMKHLRPDVRQAMKLGRRWIELQGLALTPDESAFAIPASLRRSVDSANQLMKEQAERQQAMNEVEPTCHYCGAPASPSADDDIALPTCRACRDSIDEGEAEFAAAEEAADRTQQRSAKMYLVGLVIIIVVAIAAVILDSAIK
jgi:hypothetical protein